MSTARTGLTRILARCFCIFPGQPERPSHAFCQAADCFILHASSCIVCSASAILHSSSYVNQKTGFSHLVTPFPGTRDPTTFIPAISACEIDHWKSQLGPTPCWTERSAQDYRYFIHCQTRCFGFTSHIVHPQPNMRIQNLPSTLLSCWTVVRAGAYWLRLISPRSASWRPRSINEADIIASPTSVKVGGCLAIGIQDLNGCSLPRHQCL